MCKNIAKEQKGASKEQWKCGENVCARVSVQESPQESMEMDKDLEKERAREWKPGKEERNEHLRNSSWEASVQAVR